jgi:hypothetical protein
MLGLSRFKKTAAMVAGAGATVLLVGVMASANSGGVSVAPCDPTVQSDCVNVFQPVIRQTRVDSGASIVDLTNSYHTVITMGQVPNGFYKLEANGFLDDALETRTDASDWKCRLFVQNVDLTTQYDYWENERLDDATFFLKAGVNLNSSNGTNSIYVDCLSSSPSWNTAWLKIIAVDASGLIDQPSS